LANKVFIDTSGWANLFIATESYHEQAKQWFQHKRQQNYVVIELVQHGGNKPTIQNSQKPQN
jgi:uncharacterized protein